LESVGYVAFAGVVLGGVKGFLGAKGVNNVLKNTENTITKAGNCFVAGTEILTTEGIKNIEDIRVGDWVIADDPTIPGWIEAKEVLDTFDNEVTELYDLYVDGEVISTTAEHPFWVPDKGWVKASDLVVGDLLQTDEETFVDVDKIERREGNFKVYNFEVEGFPTYFVSALGILVHNVCDPQIRLEDVTNGPHGPDRPLSDVVSRAWQVNPDTKRINGVQSRWLTREAGENAVKNLDVNNMVPGKGYSVPIPEGAGVVVRPYNEYPVTNTPQSQRYIIESVDRAVVIRTGDRIHSFPIGSEHPAYNNPAPTR
jgi:hypothetical protein